MRTVAWGLSRLVVRYDRSLKMYRSFSHIAFFMIVLLRVMQKLVVIPRNTGLRSSALGFGLECFGEFFDFFGFLDHTKGKNVLIHGFLDLVAQIGRQLVEALDAFAEFLLVSQEDGSFRGVGFR